MHSILLYKETGDLRWKVWGDGQFFKHYTKLGKKFETDIVNIGLRKRTNDIYINTKNRIQTLTGKNIDDYELFTGLQLNIKGTGNYFVADQVFVKFAINSTTKEKYIADIIIMETKLTDATKLSTNQWEAFINKTGGFSARSKKPKGIYKKGEDYEDAFENINADPTFIKCYDKAKGDEIDNFKLITNSSN